MGVAKDICEICAGAECSSSSYVIFYILGRASRIVSPIGNTYLYYEKFPPLRTDRNFSKYCKTYYFTETYGPGSKRERECQYIDRSVCEYYPTVIGREDGMLPVGCKQYTLYYQIYDTTVPTLIYNKGYENYAPILAHMIGSTYGSYLFEELYVRNLVRLGAECDIVGKVVEDYVDRINSEKEKYVSYISRFLTNGNKYTSDFRSKLEELRTTNTTVGGKLMLENIEKNSKLIDELLEKSAPYTSYMSEYSTGLLELVKIIRTLGTSHDTACDV